jgi:hypothetical protein
MFRSIVVGTDGSDTATQDADIERQIAGELIDALSRAIRAAGGT